MRYSWFTLLWYFLLYSKVNQLCVLVYTQMLSHVQLFAALWTVAHQVRLYMGLSHGQQYWSGLPFPPPGYLPDLGIKPTSPALAGGFFTTEVHGDTMNHIPIYPFFFTFFSHVGHYRILSRVPCTNQHVLVDYLFYIYFIYIYIYVKPNLQGWVCLH